MAVNALKKNFLGRNIIPILWIAGILYTLPVYNKYWAPYDEGIITVAAQRLLAGELPYRDFFILLYPPGQIYVVAAILKLIPQGLLAARIYTVLISAGTAVLVFAMARMLTKRAAPSVFAWLLVMTSLCPRLGAIPAPIWPGVGLALCSVYLFMLYLRRPGAAVLAASGAVCGAAIAFRHDIGIFSFLAVAAALSADGVRARDPKPLALFSAPALAVTFLWVAYFVKMSAGADLFDSLVAFAAIHTGKASLPFPLPCLDLRMIFHGSLRFINENQYYIPVIAYLFTAVSLVRKAVRGSFYGPEGLSLLAILLFGILTFNQVRSRTDTPHLLSVIAPAAILSAFIFKEALGPEPGRRLWNALNIAVAAVLVFLLSLLLIKNVDKYAKNTYTKVFGGKIVIARFDKGALYIPADERDDVENAVRFIRENTAEGDRIYVGNAAHWKDDFGGSTMLYFLSDRLPSTKFYELAPGLTADERVQREMADSLAARNVKLLILQDIDAGVADRKSIPASRFLLDDYIASHYKEAAAFGKYHIYLRK